MDCDTLQELLVPFLEGELSPSEQELAEDHLTACARCSDLASRISSQDAALASLPPEPDPRLSDAAFWGPMTAAVDAAWDARAQAPDGPAAAPEPPRRELRVTPVGLTAYAAALLLALAWGWSNHRDAERATAEADALRAEQSTAVPSAPARVEALPSRSSQPYQPVRYTPRRGTF